MRRLPWHVAVRADRKAILTALAIGLSVAFSVVGFALAGALHGETVSQEGRFAQPDDVIARKDGATFDARLIQGARLVVLLVDARAADGGLVTLAGVEGRDAPIGPGAVASADPESTLTRLKLAEPVADLALGTPIGSAYLSESWFVLDAGSLRAMVGAAEGSATYAIADVATQDPAFTSRQAPGVEPFFRASGVEVARDLSLLVAFSSILIGLFSYEFLRTEIREKRREIGLWRSIGIRVQDLVPLLLARGAFIAATGAAIGSALALGALGAAAQVTGSGVFRGTLTFSTAALLFAAFVAASLVGAVGPVLGAARATVRDWLETSE